MPEPRAGGHRLAALQALQETNPEIYNQQFSEGQIQVYMLAFDAEQEPERALQVKLAENEKRVNYTRDRSVHLSVVLDIATTLFPLADILYS